MTQPRSALFKTILTCLFVAGLAFILAWASRNKSNADTITLHGACIFDDEHSYTKALVRFAELVEEYYDGPRKVQFVLHKNSELGTRKRLLQLHEYRCSS